MQRRLLLILRGPVTQKGLLPATCALAAIAVVAAGLVLWAIFGGKLVPPIAVQPSVAPRRAGRAQKPAASPFRNPYNRFIFAYVLLWWV